MGDVLSDGAESPRLAILKSFAEKRPQDPFPRYALAMEYKTAADAAAAWRVFEALIAEHPDYVPAYSPAGEVLLALGRGADARGVYAKGIEAAGRKNDAHAREHLEAMLAEIDGGA
jgi:predicted Zn-dependent protease